MSTTESASPASAPEHTQEPAPKSSIGKRILTYIVGLIVVGGAFYAFNYFTSDVAQAKVGDCAVVSGPTSAPQYKVVDCASAEATYTIGQALGLNESCANDDYAQISESGRRGPKTKLCIAPLYAEGKCYATAAPTMDITAIDCSGAGAMKVSKVTKDATAPQCAEGQVAITYPEVKLGYCAGAPA